MVNYNVVNCCVLTISEDLNVKSNVFLKTFYFFNE